MANVAKAQEKLQAAKALFIERYRLPAGDDSPGLQSFDRAVAAGADASISNLRGVMAQYNLYPQYEHRMAALLDEAEAALAEEDEEPTEPGEGESVEAEAEPPTPIKRATRVSKPRKARS